MGEMMGVDVGRQLVEPAAERVFGCAAAVPAV